MLPGLVILSCDCLLVQVAIPVLQEMPQTLSRHYVSGVVLGEFTLLLILGMIPIGLDFSQGCPPELKSRLKRFWTRRGGRTEVVASLLIGGNFFLMTKVLERLPLSQGNYPILYDQIFWLLLVIAYIGPVIPGIILFIQGRGHGTLKDLCTRWL